MEEAQAEHQAQQNQMYREDPTPCEPPLITGPDGIPAACELLVPENMKKGGKN
jgi:hypothetical protein